jgi:hypothetical protein
VVPDARRDCDETAYAAFSPAGNDAVELLRSLESECEAADGRLLPPIFKATVENLDPSISPRFTPVVESRTWSSVFSSSAGCDVAVDVASKSPNGVTEDINVNPDRGAALLNIGVSS